MNDYNIIDGLEEDDADVESELSVDVSKFSEAVIWGTDWTTETVARQLEKGNIDLSPSFQRRDAWTKADKGRLIESLMLGIPVPPIILAECKEKRNSYIVIDGKQRLLSIRLFFASEEDFASKEESEKFEPLKLSGLEILTDLNGKTYDQLKKERCDYLDNLENQSIRTIVIKNWPDDAFLYTVFLRLNTGSKKLSPQELRQALIPGPFLSYLDERTAKSEVIQKMLGNIAPDPRMKDVELALRYYGFKCNLKKYDGNLKNFMDETCKNINMEWEKKEAEIDDLFVELESAISFATELMDNNSPFSRYEFGKCNNRFNKNIFELFTYYFSVPSIRHIVKEDKEVFMEEFLKMNDEEKFLNAVNGTTKDIRKVAVRFELFWEVLNKLKGADNTKANKITLNENRLDVEEILLR